MKIKTSELTGRALDYAVALAIGGTVNEDNTEVQAPNRDYFVSNVGKYTLKPSTDWEQCGQLMDKYCKSFGMVQRRANKTWNAFAYGKPWHGQDTMRLASGDTLQIAFCRAVVAAQLGDEVDIPDELMEGV
ncbi:phage protein NinX family protein [Xenorhabdus hominickii]|uniref:DUF2591 domain-containing protein n=1 Tax=Xenorhabdus hominickii TaxID=351679 RepID=A0A2G0QBC1_XENHO|nr:phage protein NinX family protein [Xenorhabdus hominickii]AOM40521.1 hypothetical protein A9255_07945 [Xenorhabdus hominickii]PHM56537.1 hypothetical protein Xhom_02030 [Xenorhabdus hominickii]